MKFDPSQLNSSYPELTKERLAEIVLQQAGTIQKMQERIVAIEQEVLRLRAQQPLANLQPQPRQPVAVQSNVSPNIKHEQRVSQEIISSSEQDENTIHKVVRAVFHTSWMAILLGIFIEIVLVIVATFGGTFSDVRPFVADLFQKVSWGFLVCVALVLSTATSRFRVPAMSIAGLLVAPAAVIIARAIHFGARYAMGLPVNAAGPSPLAIAAIKSVEYACLGATLAFIARYAWGRALTHIAVGLLFGILFGGVVLALSVKTAATAVPALALVAQGLNELIFPVGCALITFTGQFFGRLLPNQSK